MNKSLSSTFNEYITKIKSRDQDESIDNWDFYIDIEDPNNIVLLNRSNNTTRIKPLKTMSTSYNNQKPPLPKNVVRGNPFLNPFIRIIPVPLKTIKSGEEMNHNNDNNDENNDENNNDTNKNNDSYFTILNNKVYMVGVAIVCLIFHII
jgi:hypothetical protein